MATKLGSPTGVASGKGTDNVFVAAEHSSRFVGTAPANIVRHSSDRIGESFIARSKVDVLGDTNRVGRSCAEKDNCKVDCAAWTPRSCVLYITPGDVLCLLKPITRYSRLSLT